LSAGEPSRAWSGWNSVNRFVTPQPRSGRTWRWS
jgi:hypothetical protein